MSARGRAALLLIDLQQGLLDADPPLHDGEGLVRRLSRLAEVIRDRGDLVVVVQDDHGPGLWTPESDGWAVHRHLETRAGDVWISKSFGDAFRETTLEAGLRLRGIHRLIVAGCMTDFSVRSTLQRSLMLGFDSVLVSDGHSTLSNERRSAVMEISLLNDEVAAARNRGLPLRVVATDALVEELQAGRAS